MLAGNLQASPPGPCTPGNPTNSTNAGNNDVQNECALLTGARASQIPQRVCSQNFKILIKKCEDPVYGSAMQGYKLAL